MPTEARGARLSFRLSAERKEEIENAALVLGQSVSDFAVSTLAAHARWVSEQRSVTALSDRDRDRFTAILDDADARPNAELVKAARRYNENRG